MKYVWAVVFLICSSLLAIISFDLFNPSQQLQSNNLESNPLPQVQMSTLTLLTEHSPPGGFVDDSGQVRGKTVELIRILSQRLNENTNIEVQPWARALNLAKTRNNIGLFETIRSAEREDWFQWVGPLKIYDIALYARADKISKISSTNIMTHKLVACANRGSSYVAILKDMGFMVGTNLVQTVNEDNCAKLMIQGKVDLAPYNEHSIEELASQLDPDIQLVAVKPLTQVALYLAFSKDIAPQRIQRWQLALEQSYRDGTMRSLYTGTYNEKQIKRLENAVGSH